ncbi:MAG: double-strand break repair helicase AddA [Xanthobacteraceae bacterium]|nr:double-strand break repair helicase AddA [Xanthobacteraceae bacterium]
MSAPRVIPPNVSRVQIDASDPKVSAWVSANAGSGKTHVLAQRVIRLMLDGVDPSKILCITFTKAAAANMANRVFDTLAQWIALDDAALNEAIRALSNVRPGSEVRARARRLFAQALDTPGGLKVLTIHAFCTRMLHQFPFEANVAARFTVLDEASERQLLDQISLGVLLDGASAPDSPLGKALATAINVVADQTFKAVITEAIGLREAIGQWTARGVDAAIVDLCGTLAVAHDDTLDSIETETVASPHLPLTEWPAVADTLALGSKTDIDQADRLMEAYEANGPQRAALYRPIFLTAKDERRQRIVTKAIVQDYPDLAARLTAEQERLLKLVERRRAVACRDRTAALLNVAELVLRRYRAEKDRRGILDYDDLIEKTLALLTNVSSAWVHYKLDLGIDHVLIDEAQDTSPKQWQIIRAVVSDFFSGAGARGELKRTIFAVGDEKQSIFSFQGAAPDAFAETRQFFRSAHSENPAEFLAVEFKHSFRSSPVVLEAVDAVFGRPEGFQGLSSDPVKTVHLALPDAAPGRVEIWPLEKPDEKHEIEGWDAPFDAVAETSPQVRLAERIARQVRASIGRVPVGRGRTALRAGEVLILVSRRGALFEAIIRALKNADVPVAGADRLVLTEHIAAMDLMVLGDALLLPDDDLALATVLKSPLFGLDEEDLFALAWNRQGTLRSALHEKAGESPRFGEAAQRLERFERAARHETPFGFYAHLLGPERGRQRFLSRLGAEANDALDEFLNLALDYERRETPSLQGFLAWLRAARAEVKRDMEIARDEVRVMTVHGAKGLEAPLVILADTTSSPAGAPQHQPKILPLPAQNAVPGTPDRLVWVGRKEDDLTVIADARALARRATEDEYRRLLYVAMTRAADRLIVCGVEGANKRPAGCWYDLVFDALAPLAHEGPADDGNGTVWRYRKPVEGEAETVATGFPDSPALELPLTPPWLSQPALAEPPQPVPLAPSHAYDEAMERREASGGSAADRQAALERGRAVHRLLQSLPDMPPERRAEAAARFLTHSGKLPEAERSQIVAQVLAVLDDPRFAPLFAPGSRAEVPIVGRLTGAGRSILVSGQVDRLMVTDTQILIADYKTNRPAPAARADVPRDYVAQLALYRAVLARLYPGRPVRAALVWTDVPDLMEISAEDLDAELARVTAR